MTPEQLRQFAPNCDYVKLAPALDGAMSASGIRTPAQRACFLGQISHESGGFTRLTENLSYSAQRLTEVWPSRFPTIAAATPYARNPVALADKVYGGRLGNVQPGDGWRFRGRGLIQITGRETYARASGWSGFDLLADPDLAADPVNACRIAAAFWAFKGLNDEADRGEIEAITRAINGGSVGLADRSAQTARARAIFG